MNCIYQHQRENQQMTYFQNYGLRFGIAMLVAVLFQASKGNWDWLDFIGRCIVVIIVVALSVQVEVWIKKPKSDEMFVDRVTIKEDAMRHGYCAAEYVDQLCERCYENGQQCPYVPSRPVKATNHEK